MQEIIWKVMLFEEMANTGSCADLVMRKGI
jgi:hypothetical protein